MSVTQHLVEDIKDARIIHDKVTGKTGAYQHKDENFFFCLMDDGRYVGFSIALPLGPKRYALSEMGFQEKYRQPKRPVSLLDYMLFELEDSGIEELLVDMSLMEGSPEMDAFVASRDVVDFEGKKLFKTAPKKEKWRLFGRRKAQA